MKISPLLARNVLIICVASLLAIGAVEIYSASAIRYEHSLQDGTLRLRQHVTQMTVGLAALFLFMFLPSETLRRHRSFIMLGAMLMLVLVLIPGIGVTQNTSERRWIRLFGMSFQPSDFAKLAILIFVASWASDPGERLRRFHPGFTVPAAAVLASVFLVFIEVDKGTALFIAMLGSLMLLIAGARLRFFVPVGVAVLVLGLLVLGLAWLVMPERVNKEINHVEERAAIVLNKFLPEDKRRDVGGRNWQLDQSMIALTEGGWTGTGPGQGRQQLFYLPECDSDFIFAIIGQELGFVGASFVVLMFVLFVVSGFCIASAARDAFSSLLTAGLTVWIGLQAFINIGVVTGSLFQTGMTLPFISRGGTAMIACLAAVGAIIGAANRAPGKEVRAGASAAAPKKLRRKTTPRKKTVVVKDFALKP